jgi:hypothetical protein
MDVLKSKIFKNIDTNKKNFIIIAFLVVVFAVTSYQSNKSENFSGNNESVQNLASMHDNSKTNMHDNSKIN